MSTKIVKQDCGCEIHFEPISRSLHIRERWGSLCATHDAEEKAFRVEAERGYNQTVRLRDLERELT